MAKLKKFPKGIQSSPSPGIGGGASNTSTQKQWQVPKVATPSVQRPSPTPSDPYALDMSDYGWNTTDYWTKGVADVPVAEGIPPGITGTLRSGVPNQPRQDPRALMAPPEGRDWRYQQPEKKQPQLDMSQYGWDTTEYWTGEPGIDAQIEQDIEIEASRRQEDVAFKDSLVSVNRALSGLYAPEGVLTQLGITGQPKVDDAQWPQYLQMLEALPGIFGALDTILTNQRENTRLAWEIAKDERDALTADEQADRYWELDKRKQELAELKQVVQEEQWLAEQERYKYEFAEEMALNYAKEQRLWANQSGGGLGGGGGIGWGGGGRGTAQPAQPPMTEYDRQMLALQAAQQEKPPGADWKYWQPIEGAEPMTAMQQQMVNMQAKALSSNPQYWIGLWQYQHGGELPKTPEWLALITALTEGEAIAQTRYNMPTSAIWQSLAPSEQQMFLSFLSWMGIPPEDAMNKIQSLMPPGGNTPMWLTR